MTVWQVLRWAVLLVATFPLIYYLIAIYSSMRFFSRRLEPNTDFTPPVSILKPVRGLDDGAFRNFASFCEQDYPQFEMLFCVGSADDPNIPVIEDLKRKFPNRPIRVLVGSNPNVTNDKVSKLERLAAEAKHEILVFSDSDIRVEPGYLRTVVSPLRNPGVGAVTCIYLQTDEKTFADNLQTIGQVSDFYVSLTVARQLDGVKFALGSTIVTRKKNLAEAGLFQAIENKPADDMLVGRLIEEKGHRVELLPYAVRAVADFQSMRGFLAKRMRWAVVQRNMRPWGHVGLMLTLGLPWALAAIAVRPTATVAAIYLGGYVGLRLIVTGLIAVWGLKQPAIVKHFWLIPVWDSLATIILFLSFGRNRVRWRDGEYYIRNGTLTPVSQPKLTN
ncbi:MAG: glycosyltransferase [Candidatus Acidiferrales bacterium]